MSLDERFVSVLGAARTGAEWAWAEIYSELAPSVLGYMRARGVAEPEDLTGEVFVQLVRDLPRFEGDAEAFRAWVFAIAYHRLLDARRYSRRRPVEPAPQEALESRGGRVGDAENEALEHLATSPWTRLRGCSASGQGR